MEITHEEYPEGSGTIRAKIKWINRVNARSVAMGQVNLNDLSAMFGSVFKGVIEDEKKRTSERKGGTGATPATGGSAGGAGGEGGSKFAPEDGHYTPPVGDDDIPF